MTESGTRERRLAWALTTMLAFGLITGCSSFVPISEQEAERTYPPVLESVAERLVEQFGPNWIQDPKNVTGYTPEKEQCFYRTTIHLRRRSDAPRLGDPAHWTRVQEIVTEVLNEAQFEDISAGDSDYGGFHLVTAIDAAGAEFELAAKSSVQLRIRVPVSCDNN